MTEPARDELLRSFADFGSAMMAQSVLEAGGVRCRLNDLANVPSQALGVWGGMGRSVGLWVGEADVAHANELLETMGSAEAPVDPAELEAEAIAAPERGQDEDAPAEGDPTPSRLGNPRAWFAPAVVLALGLLIAYLAAR
jgi:hypothetical protein